MIRKGISILLLALLSSSDLWAQGNHEKFKTFEDSLKRYALEIITGIDAGTRFRADSIFTRMLVQALKEPYSFSYPFDSLQNISRLYAPDSTFRIITWQVVKDEKTFRRHGAIQMRTNDGKLLLYPLLDKTHVIEDLANSRLNNENWIGAIYYKIIQTKHNGKNYYTLLGYDENSFRSTRKRIEVLTFDANGRPVFGEAPFFNFSKDSKPQPPVARFYIEYKKNGNGSIRFDEELDIIIYDHLISENNQPDKKYTYIPDGDYEGFKWEQGRWVHIDKVFNFALQEGQAPVEKPLQESKIPARRN